MPVPLIRRTPSTREKFILLILKDERGTVLDIRKHPGEWTEEDEWLKGCLERHGEWVAAHYPEPLGHTAVSHTPGEGGRMYVLGMGMGLRIEGLVEGKGWQELERRFSHGLRLIRNTEWAQLHIGRRMDGPITRENVLAFVVEGDKALPPNLAGPARFAPL